MGSHCAEEKSSILLLRISFGTCHLNLRLTMPPPCDFMIKVFFIAKALIYTLDTDV